MGVPTPAPSSRSVHVHLFSGDWSLALIKILQIYWHLRDNVSIGVPCCIGWHALDVNLSDNVSIGVPCCIGWHALGVNLRDNVSIGVPCYIGCHVALVAMLHWLACFRCKCVKLWVRYEGSVHILSLPKTDILNIWAFWGVSSETQVWSSTYIDVKN